jgi:hypothetical protein
MSGDSSLPVMCDEEVEQSQDDVFLNSSNNSSFALGQSMIEFALPSLGEDDDEDEDEDEVEKSDSNNHEGGDSKQRSSFQAPRLTVPLSQARMNGIPTKASRASASFRGMGLRASLVSNDSSSGGSSAMGVSSRSSMKGLMTGRSTRGLLSSSFVNRSKSSHILSRFTSRSSLGDDAMHHEPKKNVYRGYVVGDMALVCNHHSQWANQVNRLGFPVGEGITGEELRGPYINILAKIKSVHFEEVSVFYTITRADNGEDMRGEAGKRSASESCPNWTNCEEVHFDSFVVAFLVKFRIYGTNKKPQRIRSCSKGGK